MRNNPQKAIAPRRPAHWSRRGFYAAMLWTFRKPDENGQRDDKTPAVTPPFYENRPLDDKELGGAAEHFARATINEIIVKMQTNKRRRPLTKEGSWPDVSAYGVRPQDFWAYERALSRLHFAKTRKLQADARRDVKQLAVRGPHALRQAIAHARRCAPVIHHTISDEDLLTKIICYRAQRQFLWAFLRRESCIGPRELKDPHAVARIAPILAEAYHYLDLKPDTIAQGLLNSYQADQETAEKFSTEATPLSAKSVRSLISNLVTHR